MSDLKQLFEYFESEQDKLLPEHKGEFALVAENAIEGIYTDRSEATEIGTEKYGIGSFLVQEILPPDERIAEYHTRAVFTASA